MDLNKETINKIEELIKQGNTVYSDKEGNEWVIFNGAPRKLIDLSIESLTTTSLDALIRFVDESVRNPRIKNPLYICVNSNAVVVHTELDNENKRATLIEAKYNFCGDWLNRFIDPEQMIINLRCNCVETERLNERINIISKISDKAEVITTDDGLGQRTQMVNGTTVLGEVEIRNITNLKIYRTFSEIEPIEEPFLLRVQKGKVALFSASGEKYKYDYIMRIREYLEKELSASSKANIIIM